MDSKAALDGDRGRLKRKVDGARVPYIQERHPVLELPFPRRPHKGEIHFYLVSNTVAISYQQNQAHSCFSSSFWPHPPTLSLSQKGKFPLPNLLAKASFLEEC